MLAQYALNLRRLVTGDLGRSLQDDSPVAGEIARRLPRTLELIAAAALFAVVLGIPGGLLAAIGRDAAFDRAASFIARRWRWRCRCSWSARCSCCCSRRRCIGCRPGGYVALAQDPLRHLALLSMPALTIALGLAAAVFRMTRAAVLDEQRRDHVRTAWAKGLSPRRVQVRHVLRNALMPVVTVLALHLGTLLGGTVLVEYVFNYPGLSGLLVEAVNARDSPRCRAWCW